MAKKQNHGFSGFGGAGVAHPANGFVGHVFSEVVALFGGPGGVRRRGVSIKDRVVLARFALVKTVEIVESLAGRPSVEWAGRADFGLGRVVGLAEHRRGVPVVAQGLGDQCSAARDDARVARIAGTALNDDAGSDAVMIPASEEGSPGWRAESRRMESCVLESVRGELVHVGGWHRPAER